MTPLEKTINNLGLIRTIRHNEQVYKLICLIRTEDRRPFQADWYQGKESYLVAVDENGHFFLRHSGGYIFRLDPNTKKEEQIAKSEIEFINMIVWD
ncbi:hypothetical protein [uncultured Aquimarina sp.]|uniref:hypothetical protein n=1 Tax=uncultured Aquimarina sp. TaxID=575652 RepID=UPI00260D885A|nr:hypothetical protein [uncultured Aquimarina sp.]